MPTPDGATQAFVARGVRRSRRCSPEQAALRLGELFFGQHAVGAKLTEGTQLRRE
jgi:hypothetical protein